MPKSPATAAAPSAIKSNPIIARLPPPRSVSLAPTDIVFGDKAGALGNPAKSRGRPEDLAELQGSIRQHGVLVPLLVRRSGDVVALVAGERRLRVALALELETVPALEWDEAVMDDARALEVALVENLQRKDQSPLDESGAYQLLREKYGLTLEDIAAHVDRPLTHVHRRLQLSNLIPEARALLLSGWITGGAAEQFARGDSMSQRQALLSALARSESASAFMGRGTNSAEAILRTCSDGKALDPERYAFFDQITAARARSAIEDASRELAKAPWSLDDEELVAAAGSCTACPKRSRAQAELFAGGEGGRGEEDLCMDGACWGAKITAHREREIASAKLKGIKVLGRKDSAALYGRGTYLGDRKKVDLDSPCDLPGKRGSWRTVVRSIIDELEVELATDGDGLPHHLVDRNALERACKAAGIIRPEKRQQRDGDEARRANERAAAVKLALLEDEIALQIAKAATALPMGDSSEEHELWELIARTLYWRSLPRAQKTAVRRMFPDRSDKSGREVVVTEKEPDEVFEALLDRSGEPRPRALNLRLFVLHLSMSQGHTFDNALSELPGVATAIEEHSVDVALAFAADVFDVSADKAKRQIEREAQPPAKKKAKAKIAGKVKGKKRGRPRKEKVASG